MPCARSEARRVALIQEKVGVEGAEVAGGVQDCTRDQRAVRALGWDNSWR